MCCFVYSKAGGLKTDVPHSEVGKVKRKLKARQKLEVNDFANAVFSDPSSYLRWSGINFWG